MARLYSAGFLCALLGIWCGADRAPPRAVTDKPLPIVESKVVVPLSANLSLLQDQLDKEIPQQLAKVDEDRSACVPAKMGEFLGIKTYVTPDIDCHVSASVQRNGPVQLSGSGQAVTIVVPVAYSVAVRGRGEVGRNINASANGGMNVRANVVPSLREDWTPAAQVNPDFSWTQPPVATVAITDAIQFPVSFGGAAEPEIRRTLTKFASEVPSMLAKLKVREEVEKGWKQAHQPILIVKEPQTWLAFAPKSAAFSGISVENNIVRARIMATGLASVSVGAQPPAATPSPLPPLQGSVPPDAEFAFVVPVTAKYATLEEIARKELKKGIKWDLKQFGREGKLEFDDVSLYPSNDRLVAGLKLRLEMPGSWFDSKGSVYLVGQPVIVNETRVLSVRNFDYVANTDNSAINTLVEILRFEPVRKLVEGALTYKFGDELEKAMKEASANLNRDLGDGLKLAGRLERVRVENVDLLANELRLPVRLEGAVTVGYGL